MVDLICCYIFLDLMFTKTKFTSLRLTLAPVGSLVKYFHCNWLPFNSFATQSHFLTTLRKKPFENIGRKGENADDQHFLFFPQCFLHYKRQVLNLATFVICIYFHAQNLQSDLYLHCLHFSF